MRRRRSSVGRSPGDDGRRAPTEESPLARARTWLRESALGPLVARGLAWGLGLAGLAAVGSGAASAWLPMLAFAGSVPAPQHTASIAGMAALPQPTASPVAASGSAPGADAGAPELSVDAGAADASPPVAGGGPGITADGKVILNVAKEDELRKLPGIGPSRARAILALREKMGGRFKRVEDLLRVKGIGRRSLARLRPLCLLDAP